MSEINILHLIYNDTFIEIKRFLSLKDIFNLRCVSSDFRDYFDNELAVLKVLNFAGQDDRAVSCLKLLNNRCMNLRTINFSNCRWLTNDLLIPMLFNNSHTLREINLSRCENLTEMAIHPLIIHCKQIKKLVLSHCSHWLTIGSLEALIFHHCNIEELDLTGCVTMSERCLTLLLQKFQKLKVLCLASMPCVNDNILFNISKFQSDIVHLNLFNCNAITDRGVGALSLNCKHLETLSVRGCHLITDRSLNLLRSRNVHIDVSKTSASAFIIRFNQFARQRQFYLQV
ncbi:hypothetical protein PVAND_005844 [Polypedilum vanderplanki]|uniref:Uncharacterized protein n=1 Tax=Polypedilum vanderplanki TaxID=319348 RepID=A0A9J6C1E5_POLVA|nr:hypothetical protein PVAND_005844 [Polypedilum vanderplanki]